MTKAEKEHMKNVLKNVYNTNEDEYKSLNDKELTALLKTKEEDQLAISQNPNKFWYLKELPPPKIHEVKTKKIWGAVVVGMLFLTLLGFLALFIVLAYR